MGRSANIFGSELVIFPAVVFAVVHKLVATQYLVLGLWIPVGRHGHDAKHKPSG